MDWDDDMDDESFFDDWDNDAKPLSNPSPSQPASSSAAPGGANASDRAGPSPHDGTASTAATSQSSSCRSSAGGEPAVLNGVHHEPPTDKSVTPPRTKMPTGGKAPSRGGSGSGSGSQDIFAELGMMPTYKAPLRADATRKKRTSVKTLLGCEDADDDAVVWGDEDLALDDPITPPSATGR